MYHTIRRRITGEWCSPAKSLSVTYLTKNGVVEPSNTAVCIQSSKLILVRDEPRALHT